MTPEQLLEMQQRIVALENFITQTQATNTQPDDSASNMTDTEETDAAIPLHSLPIRASTHWIPPPLLTERLQLQQPLCTSPSLTADQRGRLIEQYPCIEDFHYQPPATLPAAASSMTATQAKFDRSLKSLQYLISGVIRPMDVLGFSIVEDNNQATLDRYLKMLADCRTLLLNVSTEITNLRNNLAFQAINPRYSNNSSSDPTQYTMDPALFQASVAQQTTTAQTFRQARPKKRNNNNNNNSGTQSQPFFRVGPFSQQSGSQNNSNSNNFQQTNWTNSNGSNNNNRNNTNQRPNRNPNNPFRNSQ